MEISLRILPMVHFTLVFSFIFSATVTLERNAKPLYCIGVYLCITPTLSHFTFYLNIIWNTPHKALNHIWKKQWPAMDCNIIQRGHHYHLLEFDLIQGIPWLPNSNIYFSWLLDYYVRIWNSLAISIEKLLNSLFNIHVLLYFNKKNHFLSLYIHLVHDTFLITLFISAWIQYTVIILH